MTKQTMQMDLTNTVSKGSGHEEYWDSVYAKFRNRQNSSMPSDDRSSVTAVEKGTGKEDGAGGRTGDVLFPDLDAS